MATWAELAAADPTIAEEGRHLLYARGAGEALLATVRGNRPPRIHPINVGIEEGRLYGFLLSSAKLRDLETDGRFALHAHQDPKAPSELLLRGRAHRVDDPAVRERVGAAWPFEVDDSYVLFELGIEEALLALRAADEWPPRYRRWGEHGGG